MKSVLRRGDWCSVYKKQQTPSEHLELEGKAQLVSLVRLCHTSNPPSEVWVVKFEDDETPVERDITIRLPKTSGMSSSLARSPEGKSLLAFMAAAGLSDDWADPSGHGVTAWINGKVLNNEIGAVEIKGRKVNDEILVHLECPKEKITVNLNTLLILASSYVKLQYAIATEAVQKDKVPGTT